ncbi:hypothetical protein SGRI78S_05124 [Streptomyces griseus subsp. griseus]
MAVEKMSIAKALNESLRLALDNDPKVLIMGEDVGKLGGVFRITDGLQKDFGEDRVIDTPLAESGIVGTAIGLALRGYRPVVEIQFDGFVFPAYDQIVTQLAKMHARALGKVKLPVVVRIPYGGGIGAVEHRARPQDLLGTSRAAGGRHQRGDSTGDCSTPSRATTRSSRRPKLRRGTRARSTPRQVHHAGPGGDHRSSRRAGLKVCRCGGDPGTAEAPDHLGVASPSGGPVRRGVRAHRHVRPAPRGGFGEHRPGRAGSVPDRRRPRLQASRRPGARPRARRPGRLHRRSAPPAVAAVRTPKGPGPHGVCGPGPFAVRRGRATS